MVKNKKCPADLEWNWQRVMDWYGGEGGVSVKPVRRIDIGQADRRILDQICRFLREQGVKACSIHYSKSDRLYRLRMARAEDIKLFIDKGRPYAPTEKVCEDLDKMERALAGVKPRKVYRKRRYKA